MYYSSESTIDLSKLTYMYIWNLFFSSEIMHATQKKKKKETVHACTNITSIYSKMNRKSGTKTYWK